MPLKTEKMSESTSGWPLRAPEASNQAFPWNFLDGEWQQAGHWNSKQRDPPPKDSALIIPTWKHSAIMSDSALGHWPAMGAFCAVDGALSKSPRCSAEGKEASEQKPTSLFNSDNSKVRSLAETERFSKFSLFAFPYLEVKTRKKTLPDSSIHPLQPA